MKLTEFVNQVDKLNTDQVDDLRILFFTFANSCNNIEFEESTLRKTLERINEERFSDFGNKISLCKQWCAETTSKITKSEAFSNNIKKLEEILDCISSIIVEIGRKKREKSTSYGPSPETAVEEHDKKLLEIKDKVDSLDDKVDKANDLIDNKIFSLLINTVAILGIFAAIAFTGFGSMSILGNLDFSIAISSISNYIKSIFFLCLVGLLIYNLLLILIYFIFSLSRPVFKNLMVGRRIVFNNKPGVSFMATINMTPFYWIDGILLLITIVSFIVSLIFF